VLEGLERLVKASNEEAQLSAAGAPRWQTSVIGTLANRLRIVDHLKCHPELLERPIDKPLFVFGLPRTGTTLTINLLNADPARRCLLRWEALNSVPPATAGALHSDPRCVAEQQRLAMSINYAPQIAGQLRGRGRTHRMSICDGAVFLRTAV
jgi:Sulfotransferase family